MIDYIVEDQCVMCGGFEDTTYIELFPCYLSFHPHCFEEASGEPFVNGKKYTKDEWLDFAGEDYSVAERFIEEDSDRTKYWFLNGELHREDGPAVEWANGYKEWFLDGERFTEEEFNERLNKLRKTK